jgi:hypothetical protein
MKIRIKGNSLRYRLTRPEVERFAATGLVEEQINFGEVALSYALCTTQDQRLSVIFRDNRITVYLPSTLIDEWVSTDKMGFEEQMPLEENGAATLTLLVEKDYTCLDKVTEDQSDHYPNPLLENHYEHE